MSNKEMRMKTMLKVLLAAGVASTLLAQDDEVLRQQKLIDRQAVDQLKANVMFNQQTYQFVSGQLISGPPVKGAPYSAEAVNETVQTLADGNRIVQRTSSMQYRDADGRERREETSAMGVIFITDPVAGASYTLHPDSQTAERNPAMKMSSNGVYSGKTFFFFNFESARAAADGRGGSGPTHKIGPGLAGQGDAPAQADVAIATAKRLVAGSGDVKTEELGNMFIEGVQARGKRVTTTIPAGEIGNDRPINIVDEGWYSPDLQMTILTKHSDPRSGETNFALKNINRSAPPPTLFEVPSDYTVNAGGGRGGPVGVAVPEDAAQKARYDVLRKAGILK
jgi:hypothetical protein